MTKQPLIILNKWRVREAAEAKRITMTRIQSELCTSPPTFYRWMDEGLEQDKAQTLAALLGCSIAQLCDRI